MRDNPAIAQSIGATLPSEIMELILSHLSNQEACWKAQLLRVCQSWHSAVTPLFYAYVEPLSMRAMSQLRATIIRRPALANHMWTLIFPWLEKTPHDQHHMVFPWHSQTWFTREQPEIHNAHWVRRQSDLEGHEDSFLTHCHSYVYLDRETGVQLVKWFMDVAVKCTQLKTLQIPSEGFDLSPQAYGRLLGSVQTLILVKLPLYSRGHIKEYIINHACNVETLIICGHFAPMKKKGGFRPFVDSSVLPKLSALHLEHAASRDLAQEIFEYHGSKISSFFLWPGSFWFPTNDAYRNVVEVKHLTLTFLNDIYQYTVRILQQFTSLTHLEAHAKTLSELFFILDEPPLTLQALTISNLASTDIIEYTSHTPFELARDLLGYATDARIKRNAPALESLTLRWRAKRETLSSWRIATFCLHSVFDRIGIRFQMDFVVGPKSAGLQ